MNSYQFFDQLPDPDVGESEEWVDSLDALTDAHGPARARQVLFRVLGRAHTLGIDVPPVAVTDYITRSRPPTSLRIRATRIWSGASGISSGGTRR